MPAVEGEKKRQELTPFPGAQAAGAADNGALLLKEEGGMGLDTLCQVYLTQQILGETHERKVLSFKDVIRYESGRCTRRLESQKQNSTDKSAWTTGVSFSRSGGWESVSRASARAVSGERPSSWAFLCGPGWEGGVGWGGEQDPPLRPCLTLIWSL